MLLQSQGGLIRVFPAIPSSWRDVAFTRLRGEGAFLVSASLRNGKMSSLEITSEKGGRLRLENPFQGSRYDVRGAAVPAAALDAPIIEIATSAGQRITFVPPK